MFQTFNRALAFLVCRIGSFLSSTLLLALLLHHQPFVGAKAAALLTWVSFCILSTRSFLLSYAQQKILHTNSASLFSLRSLLLPAILASIAIFIYSLLLSVPCLLSAFLASIGFLSSCYDPDVSRGKDNKSQINPVTMSFGWLSALSYYSIRVTFFDLTEFDAYISLFMPWIFSSFVNLYFLYLTYLFRRQADFSPARSTPFFAEYDPFTSSSSQRVLLAITSTLADTVTNNLPVLLLGTIVTSSPVYNPLLLKLILIQKIYSNGVFFLSFINHAHLSTYSSDPRLSIWTHAGRLFMQLTFTGIPAMFISFIVLTLKTDDYSSLSFLWPLLLLLAFSSFNSILRSLLPFASASSSRLASCMLVAILLIFILLILCLVYLGQLDPLYYCLLQAFTLFICSLALLAFIPTPKLS